jgi:Tfp pilus assembly protein FimV
VVCLAIVGGGQVADALGSRSRPTHPVAGRPYVVRPGDTLWSIAARIAPDRDPRSVALSIRQANLVDPGSLVPGSVLRLPSTE